MTDEHNFRALGCAGHSLVRTPNVDWIAESGLFFENTYCPSPVCGPSRASLFSGLYPQSHGVSTNNTPFTDGIALLPEILQDYGFNTAMVGKLRFKPVSAPHGFQYKKLHDAMYDIYDPEWPWVSDYVHWLAEKRFEGNREEVIERANADEESKLSVSDHPDSGMRFFLGSNWRNEGEHSNDWIARESVEYLEQHQEEPFFLFTSFFSPHHPYLAPGRWSDLYDPSDVELPPEFDVSIDDKPVAQLTGPVERFEKHDFSADQYRELLLAITASSLILTIVSGKSSVRSNETALRKTR